MSLRTLDAGQSNDPNYKFVSILGRGAFGIVSKVKRVKDGKLFACKAIDCSLDSDLLSSLVPRELATWTAVGKEKYIAEYHDCSWASSTMTVRIYMTLYEGGDLQGVIDSAQFQGASVHPIVVTACALQISKGIQTCHKLNIIHRDLKPANVLLSAPFECNDLLWKVTNQAGQLDSSERSEAKEFVHTALKESPWCHITDFGLSKFSSHIRSNVHHSLASFAMMGTPGFIAPETIGESGRFSGKSDVYALGCLIYFLCESRLPFSELNNRSSYKSINSAKYPQPLSKLVDQCLAETPAGRPNIDEFVERAADIHKNAIKDFLDIIEGNKPGQAALPRSSISSNGVPDAQMIGKFERLLAESTIKLEPKGPPAPKKSKLSPEEWAERGQTLLEVCLSGEVEDALALISYGAPGDYTSPKSGNNSLHIASSKGLLSVVKAIVNQGIDVNATGEYGMTALHWASYEGYEDIVSYLVVIASADVNVVDKKGKTPIFWAVKEAHLGVAVTLMNRGAKLDLKDKEGSTLLHYAAQNSTHDSAVILMGLLQDGADHKSRDSDNEQPLHKAAANNCKEQIYALVKKGADIEDIGGGRNPLHLAARNGHSDAVAALIKLGCNVKAKSSYEDNLAIHYAARYDKLAVAKLILDHDTSCISNKDTDGWTPLHIAARWNSRSVAELLLEKGANPCAKTNSGNTPRDVTVPLVQNSMRKLLAEAERKIPRLLPKSIYY